MQKRGKERKKMEVERITEAKRKAEREREEAEHAEILRRGKEARQEKIAAAKREASQVLSSFREPKQVEAKARAKAKTEARNKAQQWNRIIIDLRVFFKRKRVQARKVMDETEKTTMLDSKRIFEGKIRKLA